ncbi:MAG TPA: FAD-dependent oxidoreductase [Candidatus Limnocylindrales bacterium]|nr:FAD-dependent oxidoreductase [Candidatus Limnocylindrales bacterium]
MNSFDVVVAGGGPAGAVTALDLSRRGFRVALIEQSAYENLRVGETLPPQIRQPLMELGVWERFLSTEPLESYGIRTAWETQTARHRDFLNNPYGCGWHVDRARFDAMLAAAAADGGAELLLSAHVKSCMTIGGPCQLDVVHDKTNLSFSGRVLVDATGRKALLASRLGAQADVADRLIGAVTFCDLPEPARWTLIEAAEEGWWYSAPLPRDRMVFAYMTDSDLWNADRWHELIAAAPLTFERVGTKQILPPSMVVSAGSLVRHPVAGANWIATGDAALAFDPLSGQGVLKSIESGTRCAAAIAGYLAGNRDAFNSYVAWVQETYNGYLSVRRQFYSAVLRWPGSQFWKRRQSM